MSTLTFGWLVSTLGPFILYTDDPTMEARSRRSSCYEYAQMKDPLNLPSPPYPPSASGPNPGLCYAIGELAPGLQPTGRAGSNWAALGFLPTKGLNLANSRFAPGNAIFSKTRPAFFARSFAPLQEPVLDTKPTDEQRGDTAIDRVRRVSSTFDLPAA
jgi:hypothetical protein